MLWSSLCDDELSTACWESQSFRKPLNNPVLPHAGKICFLYYILSDQKCIYQLKNWNQYQYQKSMDLLVLQVWSKMSCRKQVQSKIISQKPFWSWFVTAFFIIISATHLDLFSYISNTKSLVISCCNWKESFFTNQWIQTTTNY